MNLTPHFAVEEFACHNGEQVPESLIPNCRRLAENLEVLRVHLGKPVVIVSGYRSPAYNKGIGGAPKSQHMTAIAADIRVPGVSNDDVADVIEHLIKVGKMQQGGLGRYEGWAHYDVRGTKARWDNRRDGHRG